MNKGIIESIRDNTATVRIPDLNKIEGAVGATPNSELAKAVICTLPGYVPNLRVGDIVLVDYENYDYAQPVILGMLFTDRVKSGLPDIHAGSLDVTTNSTLSKDTTIGNVSAESLAFLEGLEENAQIAINEFRKLIDENTKLDAEQQMALNQLNETVIPKLNEQLKLVKQQTENLTSTISLINNTTESLKSSISTIQTTVKANKTDVDSQIKELLDKITDNENSILSINEWRSNIILDSKNYGSTLPEKAQTGQLFFQIKE